MVEASHFRNNFLYFFPGMGLKLSIPFLLFPLAERFEAKKIILIKSMTEKDYLYIMILLKNV